MAKRRKHTPRTRTVAVSSKQRPIRVDRAGRWQSTLMDNVAHLKIARRVSDVIAVPLITALRASL